MPLVEKVMGRLRWHLAMRFGMFTDAGFIQEKAQKRRSAGKPVLVNLGCGTRLHPDWVNIDFRGDGKRVATWDLRTPIPLPDHSCDAIYASHVIEHFVPDDARRLVRECRRLLRPGGCLRLAAPDLEMIARSYLKALDAARLGDPAAAARYDWMIIEMIDQMVRHRSGGEMMKYWAQDVVPEDAFVAQRVGAEYTGARQFSHGLDLSGMKRPTAADVGKFRLGGEVHLWMYDDYSLPRLLRQCGFGNAGRRKATESAILNFSAFHLDTEEDGSVYKPDSFFVEGIAV